MAVGGPEDNGEELEAFLRESNIKLPSPSPQLTGTTQKPQVDDLDDPQAKKDREKNRVDKAWDDFNKSLKSPTPKGQSDADAAAEAVANLLEKLFSGILLAQTAALHPKEGIDFAKQQYRDTKQQYRDTKKDLQEKVDNVENFGKKTGNVFKDLLNYANEVKQNQSLTSRSTTTLFSAQSNPPKSTAQTPSPEEESTKKSKISPRPRGF